MNLITADNDYDVQVQCPNCGFSEDVVLNIQAQLTQVRGEAKLGIKCSSKKNDHQCVTVGAPNESGTA